MNDDVHNHNNSFYWFSLNFSLTTLIFYYFEFLKLKCHKTYVLKQLLYKIFQTGKFPGSVELLNYLYYEIY